MRFITYPLLTIAALVVIMLSVANRAPVGVTLWPDLTDYGVPASPGADVPLFLLALGCGAVGFVLGAAREYLREARVRRAAAAARKEVGALKREVENLKSKQQMDEDDEIIALTSR
jgi:uncharacterized integral membrane protein